MSYKTEITRLYSELQNAKAKRIAITRLLTCSEVNLINAVMLPAERNLRRALTEAQFADAGFPENITCHFRRVENVQKQLDECGAESRNDASYLDHHNPEQSSCHGAAK